MTDLSQPRTMPTVDHTLPIGGNRRIALLVFCLLIIALIVSLTLSFYRMTPDNAFFLDSTPGELAVWMADQSEEDAPESILGQYAQGRRIAAGEDRLDEAILLAEFQTGMRLWGSVLAVVAIVSIAGMFMGREWHRIGFLVVMVGTNALIYIFPPTSGNHTTSMIMGIVALTGLVLLISKQHVERYIGFLVVLSAFTLFWEGGKAFAEQFDGKMTLPATEWDYEGYSDLDAALTALAGGEVNIILADRNALRDVMAEYPEEVSDEESPELAYPDLRYITGFEREVTRLGRPVEPELPGRVAVAVRADDAVNIASVTQFDSLKIATITDSFAETDFLSVAPRIILVDMKILNDLNMPHLQSIAEALLQPARRNGPLLLIRILYGAALYTWSEAILGFVFGALLGFILGSVFAHVALLQRSLLPYVIASQTIPIIAIAPMIVLWLRDTHPILPVAVISAYLTFFPVTINTLRGLQSPDAMAFDLMNSYAANRWQVMWKLRLPAALPYIFTALKVSATASVVGAIIGELPSSIRNGLGRVILDFSSDYSLISTPKLWGSIFMAAVLGIVFFVIVAALEWILLRSQSESSAT